ncbi:class I SAM-dependent methyltransferase [Mesorhizobium prunaredense]|uniref:class I SAM-dependent methyltransferase n=1 Tax=Mesorhizobium prunaredense TaxID=1631249 RepID=UPI0009862902|nr:class I SAM-dependent methyltransferase [Mesorhizobium prunaredense]
MWLGLLDNQHLDEVGRVQYARWSKYGDEAYNLSGLLPWEERVIADYYPSSCSILVGAAGGGREPVALARMGYHVDAFDSTPVLAECCRQLMEREQLPGKVFVAGAGRVPDDVDGQYDGVVIGWGGYMHIPGRGNRVAFLTALRRRVAAGAPLLLSFFCRRERSRRHDWIHAFARQVRYLRRSRDPVEYGDTLASTFDHFFTEAEIRTELAEAGFELFDYRESPYGHAVGRAV